MKVAVDKITLLILLGIIVVTTIAVVILQSIRPMITAEIRVTCEQINFDTPRPEANHPKVSLLNSGLWITKAKVSQFDRILFKAPRSIRATELARLSDGTQIVISPTSPNGHVTLSSSEEAFSLRDVFMESAARTSWGVHNTSQYILILNTEDQDQGELSASFSTGDSLHFILYNCAFLNHRGEMLYQTEQDAEESFAFPVSFGQRQANVVAYSGQLELEIESQPESYAENIDVLRELPVKNVDYSKKEYSQTGEIRERNTIVTGVLKRPAYSLEDSVKIQKGDFITATPGEGFLESLRADSSSLVVSIKYDVRSMKIGPYRNAEHELVRSKLVTLWKNQTLIIIYTVSIALFSLITNFIVRRKKEED
ncbi:MAG: hypothetical protein JSV84_00040 [Gemmatimonadota bacterium]|nr:MAG: hypothetical protein JSV84_00040 [Gemmatimonadota bacterium]